VFRSAWKICLYAKELRIGKRSMHTVSHPGSAQGRHLALCIGERSVAPLVLEALRALG